MADTRDKTELAEERTDWAEDRTAMASERTFAGWMRTGMAAVAIALGLRALFRPFEPTWIPKIVASIFILIAIGMFFSARRKAVETARRLTTHAASPQGTRNVTLIASALSVGAAATGVILLFL